MKTYTTITYVLESKGSRVERTMSFIRPRRAQKPTYLGAARMVAAHFQSEGADVSSSDVSVCRVEMCGYFA